MANHYARVRRNRDAWLSSLLADQAATTGADLDDLQDYVDSLDLESVLVIALDSPAPARGYAILLVDKAKRLLVRLHILTGQPLDAYAALFSQIAVQAKDIGGALTIDVTALAENVRAAILEIGADYGLTLDEGDAGVADEKGDPKIVQEDAPTEDGAAEDAPTVEDVVETLAEGDPVSVEADRPDFMTMKKAELVAAAEAAGLDSSGTAAELRASLIKQASTDA